MRWKLSLHILLVFSSFCPPVVQTGQSKLLHFCCFSKSGKYMVFFLLLANVICFRQRLLCHIGLKVGVPVFLIHQISVISITVLHVQLNNTLLADTHSHTKQAAAGPALLTWSKVTFNYRAGYEDGIFQIFRNNFHFYLQSKSIPRSMYVCVCLPCL